MAKPRPFTNGILQSLGLDLNINDFAKFHRKISHASRTYVTYENMMSYVQTFSQTWCYIRKCNMSDLVLHTKMCNVQLYVTHEYEMRSIRTYVTYENVICPNVCYTREDVLCRKCIMSANLCYTRIWDYFYPNQCYIGKCVMSKTYVTHENVMVSELILHMKICNVLTHVALENMMSRVRTNSTYENV